MSDKTGGPAFPHYYDLGGPYPNYSSGPGMTLRDYFAGQALASMEYSPFPADDNTAVQLAARAYRIADAMLAERSKP